MSRRRGPVPRYLRIHWMPYVAYRYPDSVAAKYFRVKEDTWRHDRIEAGFPKYRTDQYTRPSRL